MLLEAAFLFVDYMTLDLRPLYQPELPYEGSFAPVIECPPPNDTLRVEIEFDSTGALTRVEARPAPRPNAQRWTECPLVAPAFACEEPPADLEDGELWIGKCSPLP